MYFYPSYKKNPSTTISTWTPTKHTPSTFFSPQHSFVLVYHPLEVPIQHKPKLVSLSHILLLHFTYFPRYKFPSGPPDSRSPSRDAMAGRRPKPPETCFTHYTQPRNASFTIALHSRASPFHASPTHRSFHVSRSCYCGGLAAPHTCIS